MPQQLPVVAGRQRGIVVVAVAAEAEAVQLLLVWQLVFVVNGTVAGKTKIFKFMKSNFREIFIIYQRLFVMLSTASWRVCPSQKLVCINYLNSR